MRASSWPRYTQPGWSLTCCAWRPTSRRAAAGFIQAFTGSNRYVLDYLLEEVLSREPEPIQSFLKQTSILGRLCGPLCDAVTGRQDGQGLLERLESANLFLIPLNYDRRWYRYHPLFAELLCQQINRS
jgi:LuxR family maltose regulon positive regulatory protein